MRKLKTVKLRPLQNFRSSTYKPKFVQSDMCEKFVNQLESLVLKFEMSNFNILKFDFNHSCFHKVLLKDVDFEKKSQLCLFFTRFC